MGFIAYTDQTGNSSKAAYSQVQTVPSHDAQQAEVTTQASLSPPPTTANHPDSAKFERSATLNAINTHKRYNCLPENFTARFRHVKIDAISLIFQPSRNRLHIKPIHQRGVLHCRLSKESITFANGES
ncbi:TPA: hypothetical protein ACGSC0_001772 [Escherichia coli]|uniref:hypothetical protein n=1 Tax=Escherichia coli TaxID=562 RepID=UPI003729A558